MTFGGWNSQNQTSLSDRKKALAVAKTGAQGGYLYLFVTILTAALFFSNVYVAGFTGLAGGFTPSTNLKALAPVLIGLIVAAVFLPFWAIGLVSFKGIRRVFIATALLFFAAQMLGFGAVHPVYRYDVADDRIDFRLVAWTVVRLLLIFWLTLRIRSGTDLRSSFGLSFLLILDTAIQMDLATLGSLVFFVYILAFGILTRAQIAFCQAFNPPLPSEQDMDMLDLRVRSKPSSRRKKRIPGAKSGSGPPRASLKD